MKANETGAAVLKTARKIPRCRMDAFWLSVMIFFIGYVVGAVVESDNVTVLTECHEKALDSGG